MDFVYYRDGDFISKSSSSALMQSLRNHGLIDQDGSEIRVSYCGLVISENKFNIFFPKGHTEPEQVSKIDEAVLLMDCICKYTATHGSNVYIDDQSGGDLTGTPLPMARQLVQDYLKHGLYRLSGCVDRLKSNGRINWNRTIKSVVPIISSNMEFVYTDFYTRYFNYSIDNEVTRIHAAVIAGLDQKFGWWISGSNRGVAPELAGTKLDISPELAIRAIRKEMNNVFSDREINLLKNLITCLNEEFISDCDAATLSGITNFEHLWERMCAIAFSDESENYIKAIPVPAYKTGTRFSKVPQSRQRMDIIISKGEKIAILDAKYYDLSVTKPGWGDLVKQFYYKKSLDAVIEAEVNNYFVVPAVEGRVIPDLAVVLKEDGSRLDVTFPPINIMPVDVGKIMRAYMGRGTSSEFRDTVLDD